MASLFTLITSDGTTTYYGSVYIDGKRYRKKLSTTKSTAKKMLTQYERVLAINPPTIIHNEIPLVQAKLKFLKDIELTSNIHQKYFAVIQSTLNRFITFCKSHDVVDVGNVAVDHAKDYFHLRCNRRD